MVVYVHEINPGAFNLFLMRKYALKIMGNQAPKTSPGVYIFIHPVFY